MVSTRIIIVAIHVISLDTLLGNVLQEHPPRITAMQEAMLGEPRHKLQVIMLASHVTVGDLSTRPRSRRKNLRTNILSILVPEMTCG